MKRLLCAGAPDIYQVCKVFRAGERGGRHNPEFTMIEWYRLDFDHHALMRDVDALIRRGAWRPYLEPGPSESVTYRDGLRAALGVDPLHAPVPDPVRRWSGPDVGLPESMRAAHARDDVLDLAMGTVVAESFARDRLTFLYDFPASQAALAQSPRRSRVALRGVLGTARTRQRLSRTRRCHRTALRASRPTGATAPRARTTGRVTPTQRFLAALAARAATLRRRCARFRPPGDGRRRRPAASTR